MKLDGSSIVDRQLEIVWATRHGVSRTDDFHRIYQTLVHHRTFQWFSLEERKFEDSNSLQTVR